MHTLESFVTPKKCHKPRDHVVLGPVFWLRNMLCTYLSNQSLGNQSFPSKKEMNEWTNEGPQAEIWGFLAFKENSSRVDASWLLIGLSQCFVTAEIKSLSLCPLKSLYFSRKRISSSSAFQVDVLLLALFPDHCSCWQGSSRRKKGWTYVIVSNQFSGVVENSIYYQIYSPHSNGKHFHLFL